MEAEFEVQPSLNGESWRVLLRLAAGRLQYIDGFETLTDAQGWIETELERWLEILDALRLDPRRR